MFYSLAAEYVQQLSPYQPGKPIDELERELGISEIVKLASNENPLGPSPLATEAVNQALQQLARYPDGNGFNLKQVLAAKLMLDTDQITLGNGSNELLELIARAFLTPEHEVIFSQHAFAVYPIVTQAVGATARIAPASDGSKWPRWGHDLDALASLVSPKTRVVFIANPNNPTGTYLPNIDLEQFISALPKKTLCVIDEAYFEYVDQPDYPDATLWLDKFPNLIVTRTFSKAYGLAGLRIGYALSNPEIADLLNRVRQPFNNNHLALVAAENAIVDTEHLAKSVSINQQGYKQLAGFVMNLQLEWIPSVANFITINFKREAMPIYQGLLQRGVIVRPVANYEMPDFLRVSIGTLEENQLFMKALTDTLADV
ncbi:MAG: histidinol-phosphate transaminase [Methylococcaceae bacterium]